MHYRWTTFIANWWESGLNLQCSVFIFIYNINDKQWHNQEELRARVCLWRGEVLARAGFNEDVLHLIT